MFNTILAALTLLIMAGVALVVTPLIGVLFGALSGWVVGWFFAETMLGIFASLGITGFEMWQIGAFLGFVGGFFKSVVSTNKKD